MRVLAIDTSGATAGVALLCGEQSVFAQCRPLRRTHSAEILAMIDEALQSQGWTLADIDLFACVTGPGSFTGVRIGVSTIKGFAHVTGKPCASVNALEALAAGAACGDAVRCAVLDARSRQVYAAAFSGGEGPPVRLLPDVAVSLDACLESLRALRGPLCFVGDGAAAHAGEIRACLGDRARFAEGAHQISPEAVARLALAHHPKGAVDYLGLTPYYLRAPQAERERLAREGEGC